MKYLVALLVLALVSLAVTARWDSSGGRAEALSAELTFAVGIDVNGNGTNDCGTGVPRAVSDIPSPINVDITNDTCNATQGDALAARVYLRAKAGPPINGFVLGLLFEGVDSKGPGITPGYCVISSASSGQGHEVSTCLTTIDTPPSVSMSGVLTTFAFTCSASGTVSLSPDSALSVPPSRAVKASSKLSGESKLQVNCLPPTPLPAALGDVNCDTAINSIDAALVLQNVGGLLASLPCPSAADVNANGTINSIDAALILQYDARLIQTFHVSDSLVAARQIEDDPAPGLPGEYVNLPVAFAEGGVLAHYGASGGPNTNTHFMHDIDYSAEGYPPAGGPHWGAGACGTDPRTAPAYCGPVPWGIYRDEWPEESLVHNMEHGGVIVWYNSADITVRNQLEQWVADEGDQGAFLVMVPYSVLPQDTVALTAWARRDIFSTSDMTESRIKDFIDTFVCRFNPEGFRCGEL